MTLTRQIGSRRKRAIMLPWIISQDVVKYLHEVKGFSVEEIADIISTPVKNIKKILQGNSTFNQDNIISLIDKYDKPIIAILAEACPEGHLPENLRSKVSLYKHIQELKRKRRKRRK
jgi:hypothetical protein